jgi:hypothetical protein
MEEDAATSTPASPKKTSFLANTNAFSSRFSGFSICHPIYHENTMLLATRHAIYSADVSTEETATFMLLPSWNKDMTTDPYASLCRKYPHCHSKSLSLQSIVSAQQSISF